MPHKKRQSHPKIQSRVTDLGDPKLQSKPGIKGSVKKGQEFVRAREKKINELKRAGITPKNAAEQATKDIQKEKEARERQEGIDAKNKPDPVKPPVITQEEAGDPRLEEATGVTEQIAEIGLENLFQGKLGPEVGIGGIQTGPGPSLEFDTKAFARTPVGKALGIGLVAVEVGSLFAGGGAARGTGKLALLANREKSFAQLSKRFGLIEGKTFGAQKSRVINLFIKTEKTAIRDFLPGFASPKRLVVTGGIISGVVGSSGIATWYASDNVISAAPFFFKEIRKDVVEGRVTVEDANKLMDDHLELIIAARGFVNVQTALNPILWAQRQVYIQGANAKVKEIINIQRSINEESQIV